MILQSTIDRVLAAADIVDVVKDFVSLRKVGSSYKGLCPFHDDRTPSFIVTPSKQLCKCFACGAGGNVVKFIQMHEQLTWPEAIKYLARKYGIEVEETQMNDEARETAKLRESMLVLNEFACDWFTHTLKNDVDGVAVGMSYFRSRGFRDDTIQKFRLGFSPDRRDALSIKAMEAGYEGDLLEKTGLCFKNDNGKFTDRFRGRVMFPIFSVSGRVVGFGGRVLAKATKGVSQKYVNSPESEVYSKSRELYGLFQAKQSISKNDRCYLVEGYTDVISMHQSGVENVVASSGTALTPGQVRLLHRFTSHVTMIFDGDAAGQKAALKGTDILLAQGMNIKVLLLPPDEDPDSFARSHTADEFRRYIEENEMDFIHFMTQLKLKETKNDPIKRAEVVNEIVKSVAVIPNDILRQMYVHECSTLLQMREEVILQAVTKLRRTGEINVENMTPTVPQTEEKPVENTVEEVPVKKLPPSQEIAERNIAIAVIRYGFMPIPNTETTVMQYLAEDLAADEIQLASPLYNAIFECGKSCMDEGLNAAQWMNRFLAHPDESVSNFANNAADERYQLSTRQMEMHRSDEKRVLEIVQNLLYGLKYDLLGHEIEEILVEIRNPETKKDIDRMNALMKEYIELSNIKKEIAKLLGDRVII